MNDLEEHFARLAWARAEIKRLEADVDTYTASKPLETHTRLDLHPIRPMKLYFSRLREPPPVNIKIHAGSIISEMRATLDALACTLAERNNATEKQLESVHFATGKDEDFFKINLNKKCKFLSEQDKETIAELKPYPQGNALLYALHSTDLIRKHQRLIVIANEVSHNELGEKGKEWVLDPKKFDYIGKPKWAKEGDPIAVVTPDYDLQIQQHALVAFSESAGIKGKPLIATLYDFASVVESTLKLFLR